MTHLISVIAIALSMATGSAEKPTAPQELKIVANARGIHIQTSMFHAMAPSMEYDAETGKMVFNSSETSPVQVHLSKTDIEIRASRITLFLDTRKIHAEGVERLE